MREMASSFVLRSQAQAVYSPRNIGHFGLNLKRYAHFTSPIRRYSDLVVHRALIRQLGLGKDGLAAEVGERAAGEPGRAPLAHRAPGHGGRAPRLRAAGGAVPGRPRRRGVPGPGDHASSISACSSPWTRPVPRAWSRSRPWATTPSSSTSATRRWSGSAPARPSRWATGSRSSWSRPTRSRARSCSASTRTSPARGPCWPGPPGRRAGRARSWAAAARPRAAAPPPLLTGHAPPAAGMARPRADHAHRDAGRHDLLAGDPAALAGAGARRASTPSRSASTPRPAGSASSWWRRSSPRLVRRLGVVGCFRLGLAVTAALHAGLPALGRPLVLVRPAAAVRHGRLA